MIKKIEISNRLKMLAKMVTQGNNVVDVGCDHGFLSIYLYEQNISKKVLAMDVRTGPLDSARKHISERKLDKVITTRLSDGLKEYNIGEADTLVCAGMGGPLMQKILTDSFEKVLSLKELILQPQSELEEFRIFLRKTGFYTCQEEMVYEEGKYYFIFKCFPPKKIPEAFQYRCNFVENVNEKMTDLQGQQDPSESDLDNQKTFDLFGKGLIENKNDILKQYLNERGENIGDILQGLDSSSSENASAAKLRLSEELKHINLALKMMQNDIHR